LLNFLFIYHYREFFEEFFGRPFHKGFY